MNDPAQSRSQEPPSRTDGFNDGPSTCFRDAACARFDCAAEAFPRWVLMNAVPPSKRRIAAALLALNRNIFSWEELLIRRLGALHSLADIHQECQRIRSEFQINSHPLLQFFRVRISGRLIMEIAKKASRDGAAF